MRKFLYNMVYFIKEAWTLFRTNLLSNLFSLLSTSLIFFVLALVLTGGWVSKEIVNALQNEAEVSIYFEESVSEDDVIDRVTQIQEIAGVKSAQIVDEAQAYKRMEDILGKDAQVLSYFDENPFGAFVEISIDLNQLDAIMTSLKEVEGISHIRDNRDILNRLKQVAKVMDVLGYFVIAAVGISTFVIVSHMIRQGIYQNKEQINTMTLLGAPTIFKAIPFLLEGFLLTLIGGILATLMVVFVIQQAYIQMAGPLPFIPLPAEQTVVQSIRLLMILISAALGILGSIFGLASSKS